MTRSKGTLGMLILLLTTTPSLADPGPGGRRQGLRRLPVERLADKLELSASQTEQLRALDRERATREADHQARLSVLRYDLQSLMAAETIDKAAVFAKLDEMGALRTEMAKARFADRIRIKEVLGDKAQELQRLLQQRPRQARAGRAGRGFRAQRQWGHAQRPDAEAERPDQFAPEP